MPKPAKNFDVALTYDGNTQSWGMVHGGGPKVGPKNFAPIKVDYGWEGKITFTIVGSPNVTFADQNPILAAPVTNPASKPTALDPQFTVHPSSTPTKLVVKDLNGVPGQSQKGYDGGDFNYVLNFKNAQPIDPIISNGGCCRPAPVQNNIAYYAIGAVALIALIVLVLRPMLARRSANSSATSTKDRDQS